MTSPTIFRPLHRTIASFVLPFLFSTIISGMAYRVCRAVFSMDKDSVGWLMSLHQFSFLGLSAIYPVLLCVAVLALAFTGASMAQKSSATGNRALHRLVALTALVPLSVTAASAGLFVICTQWLGYPRKSVKILLDIHQGSWLMPAQFYVVVVGTLSLCALYTGGRLLFPPQGRKTTST